MVAGSEGVKDDGQTEQKSSGLFGGVTGHFGGARIELQSYLPAEIIGGSIPHIPGTEDEAVWNAAAQACGTERVHYVYSIDSGRCWYLAAPSSSLASNPDSWCPLAAALPGNSEHWDQETVYLYEQEGLAAALRWEEDTGRMQVFLGAARTILPRIQSMDANFVTINAEVAEPVGWHNRALKQEQLSRSLMRWMFFSGLAVTISALMYWAGAYALANIIEPDLREAREITEKATIDLMINASNALKSDMHLHFSRIQELMGVLQNFSGTLVRYEVDEKGKVVWEALVVSALEGNEKLRQLNATALGIDKEDPAKRLRIRGTR